MSDEELKISCQPFGCLILLVTIVVLWAACFGVTWNGQHHGMSCSEDRGVEIR